jgi:hypothetical protein
LFIFVSGNPAIKDDKNYINKEWGLVQ